MTEETIQHCYITTLCEFKATRSTNLDIGIDEEFQSKFQQLSCSEDVSLEEFVGFDDNLVTSENEINSHLVDWCETSCQEAIKEVLPI